MTIIEYLARPEVIGRLEPRFVSILKLVGMAVQYVQVPPPSPGYEPFLVEQGIAPMWARGMAARAVRTGKRTEYDGMRLSPVVRAIRFLAKPRRSGPAISLRVGVLLAAWADTLIFETIFAGVRLDLFEFVDLLQSVAEGHKDARRRLTETCAALAPGLSVRRGPKIRAASVAHEFFLESILKQPRAYSWNQLEGRCVDAATEATRREFKVRRFDSRPACRRLRSRRRARTN